ncbi:MAG: carboxylating nicotinate-nucleotide diphosphorylase, partial [Thermoplasmata archaeon]
TTLGLGLEGRRATATVSAQAEGVLSGGAAAAEVARRAGLTVLRRRADGLPVRPGTIVLTLRGPAPSMLSAERTILNLVMHLSGVATSSRRAIQRAGALQIRATRKTLPGLRDLERRAVRDGGGALNRRDLSDGILLKSNHLAFLPMGEAIARLRHGGVGPGPIRVEVRSVREAREALRAGARHLLLDNLAPAGARRLVTAIRELPGGRAAELELSGGITPENVGRFAASGADAASLGALTHSAPALPFHLTLRPERPGQSRR